MSKISFEEALQELEKIAEKLEKGQLTLDESIKAYEKGMELKKICTDKLKEAEGKIELITKSKNGQIVKENLPREKKRQNKEDILF